MKNTNVLLVMIVSLFLVLTVVSPISACTSIYVGKDCSDNGETYVARSEDINSHTKNFVIHEHATHAEGDMYEDEFGFKMPYPAETLRYSAVEDSPEYGDGDHAFGSVGFNEAGLGISATVTTYAKDEVLAVDPLNEESGLIEASVVNVVLSQATSAVNGVEILGKVVEENGVGETFNVWLSDRNETWDFEAVSGHNWVAIKMPTDKIAVMPNHMNIGVVDVNDAENVLCSANLIETAKEANTLVEEDGLINVMKSYSPEFDGYNSYRSAAASKFLAPSREVGNTDPYYDFMYEPEHKVSIMDIKNLLSIRYEDEEYSWNNGINENNFDIRPIGVERQAEVHLLQTADQDVNTQWQAMSNIEFSVFVPFYTSLMTSTPESMHATALIPTDGSYDWTFRTLGTLCQLDREQYGANVRAYFDAYQEALIEANKDVVAKINELYAEDPKAAEVKATELAYAISEEAYNRAELITNELIQYIAAQEGNEARYYGDPENEKCIKAVAPFMPSLLEEGVFTDYNFDMKPSTPVETPVVEEEVETPVVEETNSTNPILYAVGGVLVGAAVVYFVTKSKKNK